MKKKDTARSPSASTTSSARIAAPGCSAAPQVCTAFDRWVHPRQRVEHGRGLLACQGLADLTADGEGEVACPLAAAVSAPGQDVADVVEQDVAHARRHRSIDEDGAAAGNDVGVRLELG